jgi:hypothetical protein
MYGLGREGYLEATIGDSLSITLALSLFTTAYTPNLTTDQYYSTPVGAVSPTAGPVTLTSVTGSLGTLSAANLTFTSVSGSASAYLVLFKNTGTNSTSPLIGIIDTATGLPVTPNGGNITVAWASGQVFTLCESLGWADRIRVLAGIPIRGWFGGVTFPPPRIIQHDPTPDQRIRHREWLESEARRRDIEAAYARKFGRPVPILG